MACPPGNPHVNTSIKSYVNPEPKQAFFDPSPHFVPESSQKNDKKRVLSKPKMTKIDEISQKLIKQA